MQVLILALTLRSMCYCQPILQLKQQLKIREVMSHSHTTVTVAEIIGREAIVPIPTIQVSNPHLYYFLQQILERCHINAQNKKFKVT